MSSEHPSEPVSAEQARQVIEAERTQAVIPRPASLELDEQGMFRATTQDELMRVCRGWVRSRVVPDSFQCRDRSEHGEQDAAVKLMYAAQMLRSVGVNPFTYLRFVLHVPGQPPSFFGDLPLTLVYKSGQLHGGVEEYFVESSYERICIENKNLHAQPWAAVCTMTRKGDGGGPGTRVTRVYSIDDAVKAGKLTLTQDGCVAQGRTPWYQHTKRMLQLRARSWAIKDAFPDVLGGVAQAEYDHIGDLQSEQIGLSSGRPGRVVDAPSGSHQDLNAAYAKEEQS